MSPATRPEGFEGDLKALSVVEIVQTLSLGAKTARLLVSSGKRNGEVWFKEGEITHAAAGSLFGDLAVYAMIEWTSGRFVVAYGLTSDARSITQDATYLVLEGLRRVDELAADRSPEADPVEVRRTGSRFLVPSVIAVGIVTGAIVTAGLREWQSPPATDAVAAATPVPAPVPAVARDVPQKPISIKRSAPARPVPKTEVVVVEPPPIVAPESPAAEEPVPFSAPIAPQLAPEEPAIQLRAAEKPPHLRISGKSGADGGSLTVFVDGTPAYTHGRLDRNKSFEGEIIMTPGEHVIVARLEEGAKSGVHEDSARGVFALGENRMLHITANRILGSPVKVKLGRVSPDN